MNNCSDWNVLETLSVTFPVTLPVDGFILSPIRQFDKCFFTKICFLFILFSSGMYFLCSFYIYQILLFLIFKVCYVIIDMWAKLLLFPIFAPKGFRNMTREQYYSIILFAVNQANGVYFTSARNYNLLVTVKKNVRRFTQCNHQCKKFY